MDALILPVIVGLIGSGFVMAVVGIYAGAALVWRFQGREGKLLGPSETKTKGAKTSQIPEETE
jgi:hypothetical protein